jgi:hypothetical protein
MKALPVSRIIFSSMSPSMSSALPGEMEFFCYFDQALVLQCSGWAVISAFFTSYLSGLGIIGTHLALPHLTPKQ